MSEEVAKPDGKPVRVRLLGEEDLMIFKDSEDGLASSTNTVHADAPHWRAAAMRRVILLQPFEYGGRRIRVPRQRWVFISFALVVFSTRLVGAAWSILLRRETSELRSNGLPQDGVEVLKYTEMI
jgi:hypothetical protein